MKKNQIEITTPENSIQNLKKSLTDNDIYNSKENISINKNLESSKISNAHLFYTKMDINSQNELGYTPIYLAILSNDIIALNELLSLGANPNIPNNLGETPLYLSVDKENYDSLIILLQYNIDVNHAKKNGNTALHLATQKKLYNYILALLRNGATPNIQNKLYGQTAMHLAVINQVNEDLLSLFHEYKGDIYNIKDKYDKTAFDYAKEKNDEYYIHLLIKIFGIDNFSSDNKNNYCYKDLMTWKDSKLSNNIKDIQIRKFNIEDSDNDSLNDVKGLNNSYKNYNMSMGKMYNIIMNMKNCNNFNETNFQLNSSKDKINYDYIVMESNNESKLNDVNSSKNDIVQIVDNTKSFIKGKDLASSDEEKSDNIIVRDISNLNINFNSNTSNNNSIKSDKIDKISLSEFLPINTISIKGCNNDANKENNINNSNNNNNIKNNLYIATNIERYHINSNTYSSANSKTYYNKNIYKNNTNNNNSCSNIYKSDSENIGINNINININTYKSNKTISKKNVNTSFSSSKQGKEIIKNIIHDTVKKVLVNTISSSDNEISSNINLVSFKESISNNSISKKNSLDKNSNENIIESKINNDIKEDKSKSKMYDNITTSFMLYKSNNQFINTNTNNNKTVNVENILSDDLNTNKLIIQNNIEDNISNINVVNYKDSSKENNVFITTTNSNIFSELQMNTNNNFSLSYSRNFLTEEDNNNKTKVNEENKMENTKKEYNNKNKLSLDLKESESNSNNNYKTKNDISLNINTINSNKSGSINSDIKNKNGTICKISKNVIKKNIRNKILNLTNKKIKNDDKSNQNNSDFLKSKSFIEEKVSDEIKDNFGMNIFNQDNQNIQNNKNKKNKQIYQRHHRQLSYHINYKTCLNKEKKESNEKNNNKIYHNKNNMINWYNKNNINAKKNNSKNNNINISTSSINNNKQNSSIKNLKIASIDSNKNNICLADCSMTSTSKNIKNTNNSNVSKSRNGSANTCINNKSQKTISNKNNNINSNKIKKRKNCSQDNINNNDCNKCNIIDYKNNSSQCSKDNKKSMSSKNTITNLKEIENNQKNIKLKRNSGITTTNSNIQSNHFLSSNLSSNNNISRNKKNKRSNLNIENEHHYNDYNCDAEFNIYNESYNYNLKEISTTILIHLRDWLISCDLLCYYNLLIKSGMYDIDSFINDYQEGITSIKYKDLENIGIKKPGHIFRFLLKLEIDSGIIDNYIYNYIIEKMNYNSFTSTLALTSSTNDIRFCGIPICNNGGCCGRKKTKIEGIFYNDLNGFLKNRDLLKFKANFIHNGFDKIEYILIQLFSKYEFNKQILNDCFHIYSERDKLNLLSKLLAEKKMICDDCNISFDSNELNKLIESKAKLNKYKKNNEHKRGNSNFSNFEISHSKKKNNESNNDNNNMCIIF